MTSHTVHAFGDDALGHDDAVALAARLKRGEVSAAELVDAALSRTNKVNPALNAIVLLDAAAAKRQALQVDHHTIFAGIPSFIKDNTDVAGWPTRQGSRAIVARPAKTHGAFATQFLAQGLIALGKSALPEFGFNASTEPAFAQPTANPWDTRYSAGGSSGGAAALVAAGVVPIAHANDGGGSIRIPAACCGLVGLKPTRGRTIPDDKTKILPINIVNDGVVTRSVRDTALFLAGAERHWQNPKLPPVGWVTQPSPQRRRIGLVLDSVLGHATDTDTRAAVEHTALLLEQLGHHVDIIPAPASPIFADDFNDYWAFLAFLVSTFGSVNFGKGFDAIQMDALSYGLVQRFRARAWRLPQVLYRLKQTEAAARRLTAQYDAILSPVLAHTTPLLGHLTPEQTFDELMDKLRQYVSFTPLNNANGTPAISLPLGRTSQGLPIGVQLSAAHGAERVLLELALELEETHPWQQLYQQRTTLA